jgi:hypothetical protein
VPPPTSSLHPSLLSHSLTHSSIHPHIPYTPTQFLEDNERLIEAVTAMFAAGRGAEAGAYQARLHANLMWLAAVADASGAGTTNAAGGG